MGVDAVDQVQTNRMSINFPDFRASSIGLHEEGIYKVIGGSYWRSISMRMENVFGCISSCTSLITVPNVLAAQASVILFTAGCLSQHAHPSWADTSWADTPPPGWTHPRLGDTPTRQTPPTPCPVHAGIHTPPYPVHAWIHDLPSRAATAADGMHPTIMHSCI